MWFLSEWAWKKKPIKKSSRFSSSWIEYWIGELGTFFDRIGCRSSRFSVNMWLGKSSCLCVSEQYYYTEFSTLLKESLTRSRARCGRITMGSRVIGVLVSKARRKNTRFFRPYSPGFLSAHCAERRIFDKNWNFNETFWGQFIWIFEHKIQSLDYQMYEIFEFSCQKSRFLPQKLSFENWKH